MFTFGINAAMNSNIIKFLHSIWQQLEDISFDCIYYICMKSTNYNPFQQESHHVASGVDADEGAEVLKVAYVIPPYVK